MKVSVLQSTENGVFYCGVAALSCHSEKSGIELASQDLEAKAYGALKKALKNGHESVLEHGSITFSIEGVSRVTTHQLVRHRMASYSQQSFRYVTVTGDGAVLVPKSIQEKNSEGKFPEVVEGILTYYHALVKAGVPPEDARYILPMGIKTNIVVTMNFRELLHFFKLRCCLSAQWEIQELAVKMLGCARVLYPIVFHNAGAPCSNCPQPDFRCVKKVFK